MQNLMGGLANALVNHGPVKVFADKSQNFESFDKHSKLKLKDLGELNYLENIEKLIVLWNI